MASTTDEFLSPEAHAFNERHSLADLRLRPKMLLLAADGWMTAYDKGSVRYMPILVRTLELRTICKVAAPRRPDNTRGYSQQHRFFGENSVASRRTSRRNPSASRRPSLSNDRQTSHRDQAQ
ncbi:hypothetical protein E4U24_003127 [Claviceps purpurea]|nr:hypothetical protein E4U24_003127 [Claviceps purpurea]